MDLTANIESAESKIRQIVEEFFISLYDEKFLVSHGIEHHRRVWKYAKEILSQYDELHTITDPQFISKLLIVCYLHDIGMSIDSGIKHGHHSKEICKSFLKKNSFNPKEYQNVLDAIENHDNKEYISHSEEDHLLKILSAADDLDALGFIGIYRYSEIYLTRGVSVSEIGFRIKDNAVGRFGNIVRVFGDTSALVAKHKKRFEVLDRFFTEYNNKIAGNQTEKLSQSGYCGVIYIFQDIIRNEKSLSSVIKTYRNSSDEIIAWYFYGLSSEIAG